MHKLNKLIAIVLLLAMIAPYVASVTTAIAEDEGNPNWVDITTLTNDVFDDEHFQFNPLGVKEIRYALNVLIDRQFLIDNIMMGGAEPMLTALRPNHPAYPIVGVDSIEEELNLYPAGDVDTAVEIYNNAIQSLNETYHEYGFSLVFKTGEDGNTWLYLVTPDGTEKQVKIYFIIRIEDERKQIGEQIAEWIEQYFHIKVEKVERERSVVTPIIYGTNPATYGFDTHPWHIYTEGWVSMTDDPPFYARYDAAFFLASLRGYGPNHRVTDWWYWFNPEAYRLGLDLYYKTYTPDMVDQLWDDIAEMLRIGGEESIRAFLTNNLEYFMVNNADVDIPVYGTQTGLWSNWGLRTATASDGVITALEFSSTGSLFMSAWNPVLGFNDVYSNLIWDQVHSFGMYPHYSEGTPIATTLTYDYESDYEMDEDGNVIGHIEVPDTALVFDPVEEQWIPMTQAMAEEKTYIPGVEGLMEYEGKVPVKLVFNYDMLKWHDGQDMSLADILGTLAFMYEWAVDDSQVTGEPDPYYDNEYAQNAFQTLDLIKGVEIINDTALAVYTDYVDVSPALIAYSVFPYASLPYQLLAAMEYAVVNDPDGTNYGWTSREETGEVGIDMLLHANVIRDSAEAVASEGVYYFNGLEGYGTDLADRVNALTAWIDAHGHAVDSNGPFYVESYNPEANQIVLKSIENLGYPKITYHEVDMTVPNVDTIEIRSVTTEEAGIQAIKDGEADIFLWSMSRSKIGDIPDTVTLIPTSSTMYNLGFNPVSNVYDSSKPGEVALKDSSLPGQVVPGLVLFNPQQVLEEYSTTTTTEETTTTTEETTTTAPPAPTETTVTVTETVEHTVTVTETATVTETVTKTSTAAIAGAAVVVVVVAAAAAMMRRS